MGTCSRCGGDYDSYDDHECSGDITMDSELVFGDQDAEEDIINEPGHYNQARVECIEIIEDLGLGYFTGCVMKYLYRFQFKGKPLEDLKKARWYLNKKIECLETND